MFKKVLISTISIVLGLSVTLAQNDLSDFLDSLLDDINFGYTNEKVTVEEITPTSVTLKSPVINDQVGDPVLDYTAMYGTVPLSELQSNDPNLLDQYKEKKFTFTSFTVNSFTITLNTSDGLDPSKIYYVTIVPRNANGDMGEISATEVCFRLSDQTYGEGNQCAGGESTHNAAQNNSAAPNMALANITHTIQGNTINLRWITIPGVDQIEIYLLNTDGQTFTRLTRTSMSTQQYSFTTSQSAPLRVRFIAVDGNGVQFGNEVIYTINDYQAQAPTPTPSQPTPSVPTVPQVGPEDNIAWALIAALLIFYMYRLLRKSEK